MITYKDQFREESSIRLDFPRHSMFSLERQNILFIQATHLLTEGLQVMFTAINVEGSRTRQIDITNMGSNYFPSRQIPNWN